MKIKTKKLSLLEQALELDPKPYVSRMGWENHSLEEALDLTIAYCQGKVGATAYTKVICGKSKATNTGYVVGMIMSKALRAGLIKKARRKP